jgi:hypothetical protein
MVMANTDALVGDGGDLDHSWRPNVMACPSVLVSAMFCPKTIHIQICRFA